MIAKSSRSRGFVTDRREFGKANPCGYFIMQSSAKVASVNLQPTLARICNRPKGVQQSQSVRLF